MKCADTFLRKNVLFACLQKIALKKAKLKDARRKSGRGCSRLTLRTRTIGSPVCRITIYTIYKLIYGSVK